MTCPAQKVFESDERVRILHMRVYRYLQDVLAFHEAQPLKLASVSHAMHRAPSRISETLTDLAAWGYLVEHAPDRDGTRGRGIRRFTLAWAKVPLGGTMGDADAA